MPLYQIPGPDAFRSWLAPSELTGKSGELGGQPPARWRPGSVRSTKIGTSTLPLQAALI